MTTHSQQPAWPGQPPITWPTPQQGPEGMPVALYPPAEAPPAPAGSRRDRRRAAQLAHQQLSPPPQREQPTKGKAAQVKAPRRPKAARVPRSERYDPGIAVQSITGHIVTTATTVTAWFALPAQNWSMRPEGSQEGLIFAGAQQLAGLEGRWLHLRATTQPWDINSWARNHDRWANQANLPDDQPGAVSWSEHLQGEQLQLAQQGPATKQVFLGVELAGRRRLGKLAEARLMGRAPAWLRTRADQVAAGELADLVREIDEVGGLVAGPGLEGAPVTATEMAWLLGRSCALGLPSPTKTPTAPHGQWERDDLAGLVDAARYSSRPFDPTVTVDGVVAGQPMTRQVCVLTVGRMAAQEIPFTASQAVPWMVRTDTLRFPVEWSARFRVEPITETQRRLKKTVDAADAQIAHYTEDHGKEPPRGLARQAGTAHDLTDELEHDSTGFSHRVEGWFRLAVSGHDEAEALSRAGEVAQVYGPEISIERLAGQHGQLREFIPGQDLSNRAHRRRMSVTALAAAVPAVAAVIGDHRGILLGYTPDGQPVVWDPWEGPERRAESGLTPILAGLGGGKTFLMGLIIYKTVRAGARWVVLDPSGPMARLARLPELAGLSRAVNLMDAAPGALNPYRLVPQPRKDDFDDAPRDYLTACEKAEAERTGLMKDALLLLLSQRVADNEQTEYVLAKALAAVHPAETADPGDVLAAMDDAELMGSFAEHASILATMIRGKMRHPQVALMFPRAGHEGWTELTDERLIILTMPGISMPSPTKPRTDWGDSERQAVNVLQLATFLTTREMYRRPPKERKGVALDEIGLLQQTTAGAALLTRLSTDTRKFNIRCLAAGQLGSFMLSTKGSASLTNEVFVGRTKDGEAQADALRLLGIDEGQGYESVLSSLSPKPPQSRSSTRSSLESDDAATTERSDADRPREFLFRVEDKGELERIIVPTLENQPHLGGLEWALNSNPGQSGKTL